MRHPDQRMPPRNVVDHLEQVEVMLDLRCSERSQGERSLSYRMVEAPRERGMCRKGGRGVGGDNM